MTDGQTSQLGLFSAQVRSLTDTLDNRLTEIRSETTQASQQLRREVAETMTGLLATSASNLENLRQTVEERLRAIQTDNTQQLEQIRKTVDERLQGTLEQRLGESFRQVRDRLEKVHRGLGEMQALAAGVGDFKKVLTNIKSRGTWGEVQLGAMLKHGALPDQFAANVATKAAANGWSTPSGDRKVTGPCGCPLMPSFPSKTTSASSRTRR